MKFTSFALFALLIGFMVFMAGCTQSGDGSLAGAAGLSRNVATCSKSGDTTTVTGQGTERMKDGLCYNSASYKVFSCDATGKKLITNFVKCPDNTYCANSKCVPNTCTKSGTTTTVNSASGWNKKYVDNCNTVYSCNGGNLVTTPTGGCAAGTVCQNGACVVPSCTNGLAPCQAAYEACRNGVCVSPTCTHSGETTVITQPLSDPPLGPGGNSIQTLHTECNPERNAPEEFWQYDCTPNGAVLPGGMFFTNTTIPCAAGTVCQNGACVAATCENGGIRCDSPTFCSNNQCVAPSCEEFEDGYKVVEVSASGRTEYIDKCTEPHGVCLVDYSCAGASGKAIATANCASQNKYCVEGRWVDDPSTCTQLENGVNIMNQSWGSIDYLNVCNGNIVTKYNQVGRYACKAAGLLEDMAEPINCASEGKVCQNGACVAPQ